MELAKTNNGRWLPGQSGNINGRPVPTGHYSLTNRTVRRMAISESFQPPQHRLAARRPITDAFAWVHNGLSSGGDRCL